MAFTHNKQLTRYAQDLRNNMTSEERRLWYRVLKPLPVKVKRQEVIGEIIVDFFIPQSLIAIELDGSQHYEDEGITSDKARDEYLGKQGIKVLRYSNYEVNNNLRAVGEDIMRHLGLIE